jgi:hypothetical protein
MNKNLVTLIMLSLILTSFLFFGCLNPNFTEKEVFENISESENTSLNDMEKSMNVQQNMKLGFINDLVIKIIEKESGKKIITDMSSIARLFNMPADSVPEYRDGIIVSFIKPINLTDEQLKIKELVNRLEQLKNKSLQDIYSDEVIQQYFNSDEVVSRNFNIDIPDKVKFIMEEIMEASFSRNSELFNKRIINYGLKDIYDKLVYEYANDPEVKNNYSFEDPSKGSSVSATYYVNELAISWKNHITGDIFLVGGKTGNPGGGHYGHAGVYDRELYKENLLLDSRPLWSSCGQMDDKFKDWEYMVRNNDGSQKVGIYREFAGKYAHEYRIRVLRVPNYKLHYNQRYKVINIAETQEGKGFDINGFKYDFATNPNGGAYCTELVGFSWILYANIESTFHGNGLDYVWPGDIYDAYKYGVGKWDWFWYKPDYKLSSIQYLVQTDLTEIQF